MPVRDVKVLRLVHLENCVILPFGAVILRQGTCDVMLELRIIV